MRYQAALRPEPIELLLFSRFDVGSKGNLAMSPIRKTGLPIPQARENVQEDRADAIKTATGRVL